METTKFVNASHGKFTKSNKEQEGKARMTDGSLYHREFKDSDSTTGSINDDEVTFNRATEPPESSYDGASRGASTAPTSEGDESVEDE